MLSLVNAELLPYLRGRREKPGRQPRQKVIGEIMSAVERTRIDTDRNFLDALDHVRAISAEAVGAVDIFWTVERNEIDARGYDLKAVGPHARRDEDSRTPEELLDIVEAKDREVLDVITELRRLL